MQKWYVITHPDGWSVQDRPNGVGILLLNKTDYKSLDEVTLVCAAANFAAQT